MVPPSTFEAIRDNDASPPNNHTPPEGGRGFQSNTDPATPYKPPRSFSGLPPQSRGDDKFRGHGAKKGKGKGKEKGRDRGEGKSKGDGKGRGKG